MKTPLENKTLDGRGKSFCIVASKYNPEIVDSLVKSAEKILKDRSAEVIDVVRVPGAFEIPLMVQRRAMTKRYDAIITLGCVIRGETDHYDLVISECSRSIAQIMLDTGMPITFGILAVDDIETARQRAGWGNINRGAENALVALEMAQLLATDKQ